MRLLLALGVLLLGALRVREGGGERLLVPAGMDGDGQAEELGVALEKWLGLLLAVARGVGLAVAQAVAMRGGEAEGVGVGSTAVGLPPPPPLALPLQLLLTQPEVLGEPVLLLLSE